MKTTCQNEQIVSLVRRAFDSDGMLVRNGKRKNQMEAVQLIECGAADNAYGTLVDGFDAYNSILIIAYPTKIL